MKITRFLYIGILFIFKTLIPGQTVFEYDDIKNIASRDLYDIISKVYFVRPYGYGDAGQPVKFSGAGKTSEDIELYVDGIYYGKPAGDLSFIAVEQIGKMIIEEHSSGGGLTVRVFTKAYDSKKPVSEVVYKDAFLNYRNLSVNIFQHIAPDLTFHLSGDILDFKDKRERMDNFRHPYERHNARLKIEFPEYVFTRPVLDMSYFRESKFLLDSDSSLTKPSYYNVSVYFDNKNSNGTGNRLSFSKKNITGGSESGSVNIYNEYNANDSVNFVSALAGAYFYHRSADIKYFKAAYMSKRSIEAGLDIYAGLDNYNKVKLSGSFGLEKELSSFYARTRQGYFYNDFKETGFQESFFENSIILGNKFTLYNLPNDLSIGYNIINHKNIIRPRREFFRSNYSGRLSGNLSLKLDLIRSLSGKIPDDIYQTGIIALEFSGRYFNDKLGFNLSAFHRYSEYFISNRLETANNLSFNIRASIVNFEFFFGSDNFLKGDYAFKDKKYGVNSSYLHQTIDGYDMRRNDEIWGVRWVFYN